MAKETIAIVIDGQDNASDDIRRVQQSIDSMDKSSRKMSDQLNNMGKSAGESGGLIGGLADKLGAMGLTAVAGLSAKAIGDTVLELNKLGKASKQTQAIFDNMAGSIEQSTVLLANLRKVTSNTVSDIDLMSGANQLMRTGVASNNAEVETLIDMALKLKKPTETAGEAIDNFSLMLANQSVERLDSFGISSAAVRLEIERLIKTGQALSREEAFKMAVMKEGAQALANLGGAIDVAIDDVAKLETRWANLLNLVGEDINTTINIVAQVTEAGLENIEEDPAGYFKFFQSSPFRFLAGVGVRIDQQRAEERRAIEDAQQMAQILDMEAQARQDLQATQTMVRRGLIDFFEGIGPTIGTIAETSIYNGFIENIRESMTKEAAFRALRGLSFAFNTLLPYTQNLTDITDIAPNFQDNLNYIDEYMETMRRMENMGVDFGGQIEEITSLRDNWAQVTNVINTSIAALERVGSLSLDDLLGRGAGDQQQTGLIGMLLGQVSDSDLRSTLQSEFALLTGQETELGQVVEDEISRQIAEVASTVGSTAAYGMVEAVQNALQTGEFLGLDEDEIIELVREATMATTPRSMLMRPSGGYTVQPGDSAWSILQGMGIPADQIQSMLGMFAPYGMLQPGMQIGLPGMGGGMGMLPSDAILTTGGMLGVPALEPIEELVTDEAQEEIDLLMQDFEAIDIKMNQIRQNIAVAFRDVTMQATVNIDVNVTGNSAALDYVLGESALNNLGQTPTNQPGGSPPSGGGGTNQ